MSFYVNNNYNILRRDRKRNGVGIMVLVKRFYDLIKVKYFEDFENIYFVISCNNLLLHFISSYQPPNTPQKDFFESLGDLLVQIKGTFIGDLNCNLLSSAGDVLFLFA